MVARAPEQTRSRILEAALEEIHHHGFQGTSVNAIVDRAQITKGALFHHFKGKMELGHAVVEECLMRDIHEFWVQPLSKSDNPIVTIKGIIALLGETVKRNEDGGFDGCPVNNLAQEMSALDEGFRQRIESVFAMWAQAIEDCFRRGVEAGTVRADIDCRATAYYFLAAFEGCVGLMKNMRGGEVDQLLVQGIFAHLDSLRRIDN